MPNETWPVDPALVTAARLLAADAVERAESGHPGAAISLAPVSTLLFQKYLRHDPSAPSWPGRDRFVLSCGHASMLLYAQLFLSGYDVGLDDLRAFRTRDSLTPGHPEYGHTPGVETTTGPLGQGLATAVGMAMAFKHERAVFDPETPPNQSIFDRHVWVLVSDGDLQEGLSYEAGALAGRLALDNLTVIYDDNQIQIEGSTALTSVEDTAARFRSQNWQVDLVGLADSGEVDLAKLDATLDAPRTDGKPRLIIVRSQIAFPCPTATGTAASHGAPLGREEIAGLRAALGSARNPFDISASVRERIAESRSRGTKRRRQWERQFTQWQEANPRAAEAYRAFVNRELPTGLASQVGPFETNSMISTRDASGKVIQALAKALPGLWGGSADLAEPNRTEIDGARAFLPPETGLGDYAGQNIHWGVREHAMGAAMNGIALAGGWRPFAGTFLAFSDYQRPAIRLASLMGLPVTYVWSHDSVALGQDGPTHQPVEHLASLRAIPRFATVRPADANETAAAWLAILEKQQPAGLVVGRQPVPVLDISSDVVHEGVRNGAYVARDATHLDVVVIASGSEVSLSLEAAALCAADGIGVRVVSMPSREWFLAADREYRDYVLPPAVRARVVVEAASSFGWRDLAGDNAVMVTVDDFGLSAPGDEAMAAVGMTADNVVRAIREAFARGTGSPLPASALPRSPAGN